MKKKTEAINVLDMIPVRILEWEEKETVIVKAPRFKSYLGKKFGKLVKKEPTYNINLDKVGSVAWKLCDGERTVRAIGKALLEKFGEEVEPMSERVAELFNIMEANKLITYKRKDSDSD